MILAESTDLVALGRVLEFALRFGQIAVVPVASDHLLRILLYRRLRVRLLALLLTGRLGAGADC